MSGRPTPAYWRLALFLLMDRPFVFDPITRRTTDRIQNLQQRWKTIVFVTRDGALLLGCRDWIMESGMLPRLQAEAVRIMSICSAGNQQCSQ